MSGKRIICAINAARRTAGGSGTWLVAGAVPAKAGFPENKSRREFSALIRFWNMAHKKRKCEGGCGVVSIYSRMYAGMLYFMILFAFVISILFPIVRILFTAVLLCVLVSCLEQVGGKTGFLTQIRAVCKNE